MRESNRNLDIPPPGIPGEFACLVFEEGGNLTFFSSGRWGICLGVGNLNFFLNTCAESKMASMTMDEFKVRRNFPWLQTFQPLEVKFRETIQ